MAQPSSSSVSNLQNNSAGASQGSNLPQVDISEHNNSQFERDNESPELFMPLTTGDILNGIPEFDPKSQESVKKFISQVDLMYALSPDSGVTILAIAKAKLVTANKLSSVSEKTWTQIKTDIQMKYRTQISFEVAQEKLLSVQQGPKESYDTYANRVRSLLDSLNSATINDNAEIQSSNRNMNENLAIRKFKQNIYDRELRSMAIAAEHTSLSDAISHAATKFEQLNASNVVQKSHFEKKESNFGNSTKSSSSNQNKNSNSQNSSEKTGQKSGQSNLYCKYCKRNNHTIETCRALARKNGEAGNKNDSEKSESQPQTKNSNSAAAVAQSGEQNQQSEPISGASAPMTQQAQSMLLQPYHYLN